MKDFKVLPEEDVFKKGLEFTGDICYSGIYGQQLYTRPMEDGGEPVNGLVYEKCSNGHIAY